ncbi:hypothetical protein ACFUJR_10970 [Streptomyces sp. NPDC057271]|uniref:hypothetical protein n=1 Tax=unclassified Streptomyces TaxID=2593676 RepID=UPI00364047D3
MRHLLLVGLLAFAVFAMHTVGHADGSPVHGMSAASHSAGHSHEVPTSDGSVRISAQNVYSAALTTASSGTDTASMCVGVISASATASPLRPPLTRHPDWSPPGGATSAEELPPAPLSREPHPARLPVLRV